MCIIIFALVCTVEMLDDECHVHVVFMLNKFGKRGKKRIVVLPLKIFFSNNNYIIAKIYVKVN